MPRGLLRRHLYNNRNAAFHCPLWTTIGHNPFRPLHSSRRHHRGIVDRNCDEGGRQAELAILIASLSEHIYLFIDSRLRNSVGVIPYRSLNNFEK